MARRKSKRRIGNITAVQIVRVWRKSSFIRQDNGVVGSEDYPQSLNRWRSSRVIALSVNCVNKGEIGDPCRRKAYWMHFHRFHGPYFLIGQTARPIIAFVSLLSLQQHFSHASFWEARPRWSSAGPSHKSAPQAGFRRLKKPHLASLPPSLSWLRWSRWCSCLGSNSISPHTSPWGRLKKKMKKPTLVPLLKILFQYNSI